MRPIDTDDYNIVKLCWDSKSDKLAILHIKNDRYCIDIHDKQGLACKTVNSWLYVHKPVRDDLHKQDDNIAGFKTLKQLCGFELDCEKEIILVAGVFADFLDWNVKSDQLRKPRYVGNFLRLYNLKGELIHEHKFEVSDRSPMSSSWLLGDRQILTYMQNQYHPGYDVTVLVWNYENKSAYSLELLDNEQIQLTAECDFEYIEDPATHRQKKLFGFFGKNPTYGVSSTRVIDLSDLNTLKIVYALDDYGDGNPMHLIFNSLGDKVCYLQYNSPGNIVIFEHSLASPQLEPKIIPTHLHHNIGIVEAHYLTDEKVCIVTGDTIVVFDLTAERKENTIRRDSVSPYVFSTSAVYYFRHGELLHYPEEETPA